MTTRPAQTKTPRLGAIDYASELNEEQLAVVLHGDGPCVVLAGAGSGKTRTIVYRVAYLLEHGVRPEEILLLTFTNKAAKEMMERIGALLGASVEFRGRSGSAQVGGAHGIWGGTFHSIANRLLRVFAPGVGFTERFTILDDDDAKALMKAALAELGYDAKTKRFPSPAVVKHVVSYARNAMVPVAQALEKLQPKFAGFADEFAAVAEAYDRKKRQSNAMDFDDLLIRLYELLRADEHARRKVASRFRYILVDEYQDTNALQAALIRLLAGERGADGAGPNLLVVGDDAQSIYSFRAADVRNILDFERFYPGTRVFKLLTNYRSTPEVLALANDIISRNVAQYRKELKSVASPAAKPRIVTAASASQEAEFIADEIDRLRAEGVADREIAVLFRATHHSQALEFELMKRGIAYDYRGGKKFFERAHVKDVLAFLRVSDNARDEAAWLRVLAFQVGIGEGTAARIVQALRPFETLAAVITAPIETAAGKRGAKGWTDCRDTLERLLGAVAKGPGAMVRAVLQSSYTEYLESEYPNAGERLDDLERLAEFADGYASAAEFLADASLDDAIGGGAARGAPVAVLSTIHQSKGLEWDAVFLMHCNESSFPNRKAAFEEGGLEEERRLFYVAVTRAREHLTLSYPVSVRTYDSFSYEQASMFLQELDRGRVDGSLVRGGLGDGFDDDDGDAGDGGAWDAEGGYEEPAVQVDEDPASVGAIQRRMKKVRTSFLREV